jgi:hypothetical protein
VAGISGLMGSKRFLRMLQLDFCANYGTVGSEFREAIPIKSIGFSTS